MSRRRWSYAGCLSRSDARQWMSYWALMGYSVKSERTRKGNYHVYLKFPRRDA